MRVLAYFVLLLMGLATIGGLWATGHPSIIDRGPDSEGGVRRKFVDGHTKWHFIGALVVAFAFTLVSGHGPVGTGTSFLLWSLVEVAQKNPRDDKGGYAEPSDFTFDGAGSILGGLLGFWLLMTVPHWQ